MCIEKNYIYKNYRLFRKYLSVSVAEVKPSFETDFDDVCVCVQVGSHKIHNENSAELPWLMNTFKKHLKWRYYSLNILIQKIDNIP